MDEPEPSVGLIRVADEWRRHPDSWRYGSDLLSIAVAKGDMAVARETASALLEHGDRLSQLAERVARRALTNHESAQTSTIEQEDALQVPAVARAIANVKARLASFPANPLMWAERARLHTLLGQERKAREAMRVALALAPESRYVLRSAARMYAHYLDVEHAYALIRRAPRTREDPWLLAAEISIASLANISPRHVSDARRMLESRRIHPAHLTELASSVGTIELVAGGVKKARRLFNQSLEAPTDNTLAQAEWAAARRLQLVALPPRLSEAPESFEARALNHASLGRIEEALRDARSWLFDQPFSREPAMFGSYHASKLRRFDDGAEFASRGLRANPTDPILRNNLAFCLVNLDRLVEANTEMNKVDYLNLDSDSRATIDATAGLIQFRTGSPERGRELYLQAITGARDSTTKAIAQIMLASEEQRLSPAPIEALVAAAHRIAAELPEAERTWLTYLIDETAR